MANYTGQGVNGSPTPNNSINQNNGWLPQLLNTVESRQLESSRSERWLNKLAMVERGFYGDIVQQYKAAFPRAFKFSATDKPEFTSNWGINVNVSTNQYNWQRVYGVDIDESEATKFTNGDGDLS